MLNTYHNLTMDFELLEWKIDDENRENEGDFIAAAEKVLAKKADEGVQQTLFKASVGEVKSRLN